MDAHGDSFRTPVISYTAESGGRNEFTGEPRLITDPSLEEILAQLIRHELIFHPPGFGVTRTDFENLMTSDFWEVGASGRRYSRSYVLNMLEERFQQDQRDEIWETSDFY